MLKSKIRMMCNAEDFKPHINQIFYLMSHLDQTFITSRRFTMQAFLHMVLVFLSNSVL